MLKLWNIHFWVITKALGSGGGEAPAIAPPIAPTPVAVTPIKASKATASVSNPFTPRKVKTTKPYMGTAISSETSKTLGAGL